MTGREREMAAARLAGLSDEGLAAALADLGRSLATPDTAGMPGAVVRRVVEGGRAGRTGAGAWLRWQRRLPGFARRNAPLRRALVLAVIAALVLAGIAAALGIGVPGIRIIFGPGPSAVPSAGPSGAPSATAGSSAVPSAIPSAVPSGAASATAGASAALPGAGMSLGRPVSLAEARAAAGYHVGVPDVAGLGPPDAAWVDASGVPSVVSLAWRPSAGAPAEDGVSLLLGELPGSIETAYFEKFLGSGTTIAPVAVGDGGWWITGSLHEVAVLGPDGNVRFETIRLAGNVLLWSAGPMTFRLETSLDLAGALAIARSVR